MKWKSFIRCLILGRVEFIRWLFSRLRAFVTVHRREVLTQNFNRCVRSNWIVMILKERERNNGDVDEI